jgi:hypothetical protein
MNGANIVKMATLYFLVPDLSLLSSNMLIRRSFDSFCSFWLHIKAPQGLDLQNKWWGLYALCK